MKVAHLPLLLMTLLCGFFGCFLFAHAQELNAGIVQGLWYSEEKVFAGDTVRIYVAIRNNTGGDLSGTVEFFDNGARIGRKSVQALNGRIIESWADWKPTYGEHTLSATLSRIELSTTGEGTQEIEVVSSLAEDTLFVDYDTDKDGIGNEEDDDDDNDEITDEAEITHGTDPLVKNVVDQEADTNTPSNDEEQSEESNTNNADTEATTQQEGLERYLTESPAENVLENVTSYMSTVKNNLDAYREERKAKKEETSSFEPIATSTTGTTTNGFGDVTRTEGEPAAKDAVWAHDFSLWDFFHSVWNLALTLFDMVYTFALTALSWLLGHPVLLQVALLLLILFIFIKLAARFGRRPKLKKL